MRIHTKLLVLLLVISVLPLLALSLRGQRATENLGVAIAARGREAVSGEIEAQLAQTITYASDILSAQQQQVELAVRYMATEAERHLTAPVPAGDEPVYTDQDFNSPKTWPPGTELALDHVRVSASREVNAVPISRMHQSFYVAPSAAAGEDAETAEIKQDMRRLNAMDEFYRTLSADNAGLFYWQYVALESGLDSVFPGHGGYPQGFDPRTRPWYEAAITAKGLTWTPPRLDASTRRLLLTASIPIMTPTHQLLGVAGIDMDILARLTALHVRLKLGSHAESYIVRLVDAAGKPLAGKPDGTRPSLSVIAATTYSDNGASWDAAMDEQPLVSGDGADIAAMADDLRAGHSGLRHMPHNGRDAVWVYGPLERLGAALVYIVPTEDVTALAEATQGSILGVTMEQVRLAGIASLVVIALVAFVSAFAARSVTRPLRELAAAAQNLAKGHLETRAKVVGRDEVGELALAFNAMVPELQSHIKNKEGLALAHEVQQKLLPAGPPTFAGYDIAGMSIYSEDVGGDYYDYLDLVDDQGAHRIGVIVGDVAGHGVVAALTMTSVRVLLRSYAGDGRNILPAMWAVNHHLTADASAGRFITLVYMVIDPGVRPRKIRWISAGHGPLLFYDAVAHQFEELAVYDIPLGVEADWAFHETERDEWPEQGVLVIGTDGIWETTNAEGRAFGKEGLTGVIRATWSLSAAEICDAVAERLREFSGGIPQKDDVTLVVVKFA